MKGKRRQEPVQTAVMSRQYRLECLLPVGSEKDPVVVYKIYAQKRPKKINEGDSSFYLAVNNNLKAESLQTKDWFKVGPVGINRLNSFMNSMAQKAGINNERLQNHSGRKTMIQTLSENDIPLTHIAQLSGHKNLKSVENYAANCQQNSRCKCPKFLAVFSITGTATKISSYETVNPAI